jgi:hypothetical protein
MLDVGNLGYASPATVLFQRLSVAATSLLLVAAMMRASRAEEAGAHAHVGSDSAGGGGAGAGPVGLTAFTLVVANAGLIMVDNIHFQYNSVLLGACVSVRGDALPATRALGTLGAVSGTSSGVGMALVLTSAARLRLTAGAPHRHRHRRRQACSCSRCCASSSAASWRAARCLRCCST